MPWDDPDPTDPNVLVGVELPGDAESMRQMAQVFAEEYAALGFSEDEMVRMFENPRYAGPHRAREALGDVEVRRIARECADFFSRIRVVVRDAPNALPTIRRRSAKEG